MARVFSVSEKGGRQKFKIVFPEKTYELDTLTKEQFDQYQALSNIDQHIAAVEQRLKMTQTARLAISESLKRELAAKN